jgi:hypothetical protein
VEKWRLFFKGVNALEIGLLVHSNGIILTDILAKAVNICPIVIL